jgi:hypothetical protein
MKGWGDLKEQMRNSQTQWHLLLRLLRTSEAIATWRGKQVARLFLSILK